MLLQADRCKLSLPVEVEFAAEGKSEQRIGTV